VEEGGLQRETEVMFCGHGVPGSNPGPATS
jgi:hypothetical protein